MQNIPKELQSLVYWSTGLLGECIREQYGNDTFQLVEKTRRDMKSIRAAEHAQAAHTLGPPALRPAAVSTSVKERCSAVVRPRFDLSPRFPEWDVFGSRFRPCLVAARAGPPRA